MTTHLECHRDAEDVAQVACDWFIARCHEALQQRERCLVALSGGSTPRRLYRLLADLAPGTIDWSKVHFVWGDERNVPLDHVDSNFAMVEEVMLRRLGKQGPNVYPIPIDADHPDKTADYYEATLRSLLGGPNDTARGVLDIVLLGMGDDTHTASLFPDTAALREHHRWVVSNWVDKLSNYRITLTAPVLNAARDVAFLVCGSSKAPALQAVWHGKHEPSKHPAQLIRPVRGKLWWMVDEAAISNVAIPSHYITNLAANSEAQA
jgi:6-phosphogluconolactonase